MGKKAGKVTSAVTAADTRGSYEEVQKYFEPSQNGKLKCTLTGHDVPNRPADLEKYITTRGFKDALFVEKNIKSPEMPFFDELEDNKIYCKLTKKVFSREAKSFGSHLNGSRFKRALQKFVESGSTLEERLEKLKEKQEKEMEMEELLAEENQSDEAEDEEEEEVEFESDEEENEEKMETEQNEVPKKKEDYDFAVLSLKPAKRSNPGKGCSDRQKKKKTA